VNKEEGIMNIKLSELSFLHKLLVSLFLLTIGFAYLFAILNVWLSTGTYDGKKGLSVKDVVFAYHGDRTKNLLEVKLDTTMKPYLPVKKDRKLIGDWIANGRQKEWISSDGNKRKYDEIEGIQEIMDQYCVACHNPDAQNSDLTSYEAVYASAEPDKGKPVGALARLSHTHGFGMSVLFMFMAVIFSFSSFPTKIRIIGCSLPFIAILMDIGSMWLTKFISPLFAYTVILGGILTGISFVIFLFGSLYDMWLRASN